MFCSNCGAQVGEFDEVCLKCAARVAGSLAKTGKSRWMAFGICIFFGMLGIHRFYLGKNVTGLLMLFTFGGLGLWVLIDLVLLATGALHDGQGKPLV